MEKICSVVLYIVKVFIYNYSTRITGRTFCYEVIPCLNKFRITVEIKIEKKDGR